MLVLGAHAFTCLTGAFPVDADSYAGIVRHHVTGHRIRASEAEPGLA